MNAETFCEHFATFADLIQPRKWRQRVAVGMSPRLRALTFREAPIGATEHGTDRICRPCRGCGGNWHDVRGLTPTAICCRPAGPKRTQLRVAWQCNSDGIHPFQALEGSTR